MLRRHALQRRSCRGTACALTHGRTTPAPTTTSSSCFSRGKGRVPLPLLGTTTPATATATATATARSKKQNPLVRRFTIAMSGEHAAGGVAETRMRQQQQQQEEGGGARRRWKVFCSRAMPEVAWELARQEADVEVWEGEDAPPHDVLLERLRDCDGFISLLTDRIDADLMDRCPRLKLITQLAVGFNNIDVAAATARGIYVTNTPDVLTETVVETTFALLFSISRRLVEADKYVRAGNWKISWHPLMMLGADLHGSKLAIIGLGRIGKKVALIAQAFGAEIIYFDEYRSQDFEQEHNVRYMPLDELYQEADFITLHVNLSEKTKHMINTRTLGLMKPTAIIVNTARGPVINQKDLTQALKDKRIRGAALDVFEQEPIDPADELLSLDNVVLAPHLGSASYRTRYLMAEMVGKNQLAFWRGERPPQLVNPDVLRVNP